jgi:hypothetical protein
MTGTTIGKGHLFLGPPASFKVPEFDFKGLIDRMTRPAEPTPWFSYMHSPVRTGFYEGANISKTPYKFRLLFIVGEGWFMRSFSGDARYFKIVPPIYWRGQNRP